jgi:uncharacterized protein with HEPN domain
MLNKDYYILLSMLETIDKIIRYTKSYHSADELYNSDRDFDAAMMNFIVKHYSTSLLRNQCGYCLANNL